MKKRSLHTMDRNSVLRKIGWAALSAAFLVTVGFTESRMRSMQFTGVEITIKDSSGLRFLDAAAVERIVLDKTGGIKGKSRDAINMAVLENTVVSNPFVKSAKVFSSIDGKLHVEVVQRDPVLRVINYKGEGYYLDSDGGYMPLSGDYTARVLVANGYIYNREAERNIRHYSEAELCDTSVSLSRAYQVYAMAQYIRKSDFWNSQIEQIYMDINGDMELIPRVGDHLIIFGDARGLEKKFDKLLLFYKEGLSKTGWNKYKTINLKYQDQVVCTKK